MTQPKPKGILDDADRRRIVAGGLRQARPAPSQSAIRPESVRG
ncbi:MAG TPA: hypothetical protein PKJ98_07125 [Verrucomicrobiota bacterium]|nr:hypothetical protein [Verrucomicrobiota bacterium]